MLNSSLQQPSHEIMGGASVDSTMVQGLRPTSLVAAGNYGANFSPHYALPDLVQRHGSRNVFKQKGHGLVGLNALATGAAAVGARAPPGGLQAIQGSGLRGRAPFLLHTDRAKNSADSTQAATLAQTHKGKESMETSPPLTVTGKKANGSSVISGAK